MTSKFDELPIAGSRAGPRLSTVIWILGTFFAVFSAGRAALYLLHRADFRELAASDVAWSFVRGLRFDASAFAVFLAPALLALLLPFRFAASRVWRAAWCWYAFVLLFAFACVLAADVVNYGWMRRHLGPEIVAVTHEMDIIVDVVLAEHAGELAAFGVGLLILAWLWRAAMRWDAARASRSAPAWAWLLIPPIALMASRSKLTGRPLGVANAFDQGAPEAGLLVLNGPFSLIHQLSGSRTTSVDFMDWDEAVRETRALCVAQGEELLSVAAPLQRRRTVAHERELNVVIVLLESWDANAVDCVRAEHGLAPLGVTPRYDALARRGLLLSSCYASGQRTMDGFATLLAGIPTLPGFPYLGRGLEQNSFAFLGDLAQQEGYSTLYVQGAKSGSFRRDALMPLAGFQRFIAMEDIVEQRGVEPMRSWGVWDADLFDAAADLLAEQREPFLSIVFTTSTHVPWELPSERWKRFEAGDDHTRYLNALYYADHCLGEFFARIEAQPWFERTLFLIASDHVHGQATSTHPLELHHVPALFLAPGLEPRVERRVTSQLDQLPSLIELAGWTVPYSSLGRSLFDERLWGHNGALCLRNDQVLRVEDGGWVLHDLQRRLSSSPGTDEETLAGIERRLKAQMQVAVTALRQNKVFEP